MIDVVNCTIDCSIQGNNRTSATPIPITFGTNVNVCSWIDVTAWNRLTARPIPHGNDQDRPDQHGGLEDRLS